MAGLGLLSCEAWLGTINVLNRQYFSFPTEQEVALGIMQSVYTLLFADSEEERPTMGVVNAISPFLVFLDLSCILLGDAVGIF